MAGTLILTLKLLLTLATGGLGEDPCCLTKEIQGDTYNFVERNSTATFAPFNCNSDCVYSKSGETTNNRYCFADGMFESVCKVPVPISSSSTSKSTASSLVSDTTTKVTTSVSSTPSDTSQLTSTSDSTSTTFSTSTVSASTLITLSTSTSTTVSTTATSITVSTTASITISTSTANPPTTTADSRTDWEKTVDANIDLYRKGNAVVSVSVAELPGGAATRLRLQVNQTRQTLPMGTALQGDRTAVCLNSGVDNNYCAFAAKHFNYGVDEYSMKWKYMEPTYLEYKNSTADKLITWARSKGMKFRGHTLFWNTPITGHSPEWVFNLTGQAMVDAVEHRLAMAVPHFQGKVVHWDVNNEMLHGSVFEDGTGDSNISVKMFVRAHELDPIPLLFVNDYNVLLYETNKYITQIQSLLDRGAPVHGIGCQGHLWGPLDYAVLEANIKKLWTAFHLPIWITEFDWQNKTNTADDGGRFHAQEITNFYKLMFSLEGVGGVLMWGFWDQAHWRPGAAIVNGAEFTVNRAGEAYIRLYHETLQTHLVLDPATINTTTVEFRFRGFKAEYNVTVLDVNNNVIKLLPNIVIQ